MNCLFAKLLFRGFVIVTSALFILGIAALSYAQHLKSTASELLRDVKTLTVGSSTFADAQLIATRFRRYRNKPEPSETCTPEKCSFDFTIDNRWLADLRLVQRAAFFATVQTHEGSVSYVGLRLSGGRFGVFGGDVVQTQGALRPDWGPYSFPTPIGKPYLLVWLSRKATPTQRDRALTFNLDCLLSRKGCEAQCDYLPLAWQDWQRWLISHDYNHETLLRIYPEWAHCK